MNIVETYFKSISMGDGMSAQTLRSYGKDIKKLSRFFGGIVDAKEFENLNQTDFLNFFSSLNLKPTSINGAVRNIKAFYSWMKNAGYISDSSIFSFKFGSKKYLKEPVVKKAILTDDEAFNLIKAGANTQERFMLALMLYTAIRRSEVCKIKLSDVNGCTILINGKGKKERKIFLNDTLCTMLSIYMAERKTASEYLFYSTADISSKKELSGDAIYFRVKAALKNAQIPEDKVKEITPHRLRGTSITRIITQFGIHAAMGHAGHANISTTFRYDSTGEEIVRNTMMNQSSFGKGADGK